MNQYLPVPKSEVVVDIRDFLDFLENVSENLLKRAAEEKEGRTPEYDESDL